ncbi:hypothetical protein AB0M44_26135 [Streptosporangium subroseum]
MDPGLADVAMLRKPLDSGAFIDQLRQEMRVELVALPLPWLEIRPRPVHQGAIKLSPLGGVAVIWGCQANLLVGRLSVVKPRKASRPAVTAAPVNRRELHVQLAGARDANGWQRPGGWPGVDFAPVGDYFRALAARETPAKKEPENPVTRKPNIPESLTEIGATALEVALLRAQESDRPDRLFNDPYARHFLQAVDPASSPLNEGRSNWMPRPASSCSNALEAKPLSQMSKMPAR